MFVKLANLKKFNNLWSHRQIIEILSLQKEEKEYCLQVKTTNFGFLSQDQLKNISSDSKKSISFHDLWPRNIKKVKKKSNLRGLYQG